MSEEPDRIRELAARVARRLDATGQGSSSSSSGASGIPSPGAAPEEMAALRAGLSEIHRRLADIESHIAHDQARQPDPRDPALQRQQTESGARLPVQQQPGATPTRSTWLSGTYVPAVAHPSQENFSGIGEAVSELVDFFESEKTCSVEPGDKPCDHCGMCSVRGF